MSTKNLSRINIDVDKNLKMEFKIKTLRKGETMTEVLVKAMEDYVNE